jgi:hypothetical protein
MAFNGPNNFTWLKAMTDPSRLTAWEMSGFENLSQKAATMSFTLRKGSVKMDVPPPSAI